MNDVIKSTGNEFVKFATSLKSKKGRRESGMFLVEGEKCVGELAGHAPGLALYIIISDNRYNNLADRINKAGAKLQFVTENVMKAICDSKTPQGITAIVQMPCYDDIYSGFILLLDGVQDPQNVGTMIRTADAAGCCCVALSEQSAGCFSPKAVRASMGSIFHIPVIKVNTEDYINKLVLNGNMVVSAQLDGESEFDLDWKKTCLVIGNESRGVSETVKALSEKHISIPMFGRAESLNAAVAAGILLYKIRT